MAVTGIGVVSPLGDGVEANWEGLLAGRSGIRRLTRFECDDFPCRHIENFSMAVGKKVILRAVPYRRAVGTEKWVEDEEARYVCPDCGDKVFRGAVKCNRCQVKLDLD